MEWICEKCGHVVDTEPKGRVCGQDRNVLATAKQQALTGQTFLAVPCAGEFREHVIVDPLAIAALRRAYGR